MNHVKETPRQTTYHIGDRFKLPYSKAIAVITDIHSNEDEYSIDYVDEKTGLEYDGHTAKCAWWTVQEIKDYLIERRIKGRKAIKESARTKKRWDKH